MFSEKGSTTNMHLRRLTIVTMIFVFAVILAKGFGFFPAISETIISTLCTTATAFAGLVQARNANEVIQDRIVQQKMLEPEHGEVP